MWLQQLKNKEKEEKKTGKQNCKHARAPLNFFFFFLFLLLFFPSFFQIKSKQTIPGLFFSLLCPLFFCDFIHKQSLCYCSYYSFFLFFTSFFPCLGWRLHLPPFFDRSVQKQRDSTNRDSVSVFKSLSSSLSNPCTCIALDRVHFHHPSIPTSC